MNGPIVIILLTIICILVEICVRLELKEDSHLGLPDTIGPLLLIEPIQTFTASPELGTGQENDHPPGNPPADRIA